MQRSGTTSGPGLNKTPAMRAKRILYVDSNVDGTVGGAYFSLLYLVSGLDRARYEPLVVFSAPTPLAPRFEAAGVRTLVRPLAPAVQFDGLSGRLVAKFANLFLGFLLEPIRLARLLRQQQVSLVHLNNSIIRNHPWMMAAVLARVPCITHERGINEHVSRRVRVLARSLRAVICISAAVRDNLVSIGLGRLHLVTIHNGLDPASMCARRPAAQVRAELGLAPGQRLIGVIGNVKPWKGQEVVVRAMGLLRDQYPDLACVFVGDTSRGEHDYLGRIETLVSELGLTGRVKTTGYRDDVADFVAALDIQVHASIAPEPFGRVLLEAMAFSKPLVASGGGAVPEIVVDGETGFIFERGAPQDLASCLRKLLDNPELGATMGRAGHARLQDRFTIAANVRETEDLYHGLLGG